MNTSAGPAETKAPPLCERPDTPAAGAQRKVLLVDDHDLMRLGVKALVDDGRHEVQWLEAASLAQAMHLCAEHADIELVLLDLNLADCKGLQGLSRLLKHYPRARIVILSGTQDEFVVRQAEAMGAYGYLHKAAAPAAARKMVFDALGLAPQGAGDGPYAAPPFHRRGAASHHDRVAELGATHLGVLELVLSGCTNQQISTETGLSLGTVKNYVSAIFLVLDVKSRSHLISLFS